MNNNNFYCPEAEQSLLACIIYNNKLFIKTNNTINYKDFFLKENKILFKVINNIFLKSNEINPINIRIYLEKKNIEIDNNYLEKIYTTNFCNLNFNKYIKIIKKKSNLRKVYFNLKKTIKNIENGSIKKINEIKFLLNEKINKIEEKKKNKNSTIINTKNILKNIILKKKEKCYKTGFKKLDELIIGLKPGEISIIAGRPSTGKTSFCTSIAEYIAFKKKKKVIFFSLEMTIKQLIIRLISSMTNINSYNILNNVLKKNEIIKIIKICKEISKSKIFINDNPYIDVLGICSEIKKKIPKGGVVFIDYVQLINIGRGKDNRNLEISEVSYHLKNISKRLNIPIVLISQLNRSIELRADKNPVMSDLRESGSLEQDADLIIFLNKKNDYREDENFSIINFTIGKNRNGPLGGFELKFHKIYTKFMNNE